MKTRKCFLFVFDGFSDWEPAMAIAALQNYTDFEVIPFSKDGRPVKSMGNISVLPVSSMEKIQPGEVDLLLLPGGEIWDKGGNLEIKPLLNAVLHGNKIVAAICGATGFLAQHGYLDNIKHTSNHLDYYLKEVAPAYKGRAHYLKQPAVNGGNIITANGMSPVEFAVAIMNHFRLFDDHGLKEWFSYFKHPELAFS